MSGVKLGYRFAAIPEWVLYHSELTGEDVRVFGVLARYGGDIRPSISTVASTIGKSRDTVKRCLGRLEQAGALMIEQRCDDGSQLTNRYHLAGDQPFTGAPGGCTSAPGGGGMDAPGVGAPVHHEREQVNESKLNETPLTPLRGDRRAPVDDIYDNPEFAAFWDQYGQVGQKLAAARAWARASETGRQEAVSCLGVWLNYWNTPGSQYQPNTSTFLNQRWWENDPPKVKAADDVVARARAARKAS